MPTRPRRRVHRPEKKVSFFGRLAGLLGFGLSEKKIKIAKWYWLFEKSLKDVALRTQDQRPLHYVFTKETTQKDIADVFLTRITDFNIQHSGNQIELDLFKTWEDGSTFSEWLPKNNLNEAVNFFNTFESNANYNQSDDDFVKNVARRMKAENLPSNDDAYTETEITHPPAQTTESAAPTPSSPLQPAALSPSESAAPPLSPQPSLGSSPPAPTAPTVTNVDLSAQQEAVDDAAPGAAPTLDQAEPNYNQEHHEFAKKQTAYAEAVEKLAEAYNQAKAEGKNPTGVTLAPVPSDTDAKLEVERKKAIEAVWAKLVEDKGDGTGTIHNKVEAIETAKKQIVKDVDAITAIKDNVARAKTDGYTLSNDAEDAWTAVNQIQIKSGAKKTAKELAEASRKLVNEALAKHLTTGGINAELGASDSASIATALRQLLQEIDEIVAKHQYVTKTLANTVAAAKTKAEQADTALKTAVAAFEADRNTKQAARAASLETATPGTSKLSEVTRLKGLIDGHVKAIQAAETAMATDVRGKTLKAGMDIVAEEDELKKAVHAATTTTTGYTDLAATHELTATTAVTDANNVADFTNATGPTGLANPKKVFDDEIVKLDQALAGITALESAAENSKKAAEKAVADAKGKIDTSPPPPAPTGAAKEAKDTLDAVIARHPSMQMFTDDAVGRAVAQRLMTPSGRASVHAELARFIEDLDAGIAAWLGKHKAALQFTGTTPTDLSGPNAIVAYNVIHQMRKDAKYKPVQFGKKAVPPRGRGLFNQTNLATKAYCNMIRVRTLALVGITCVPFTWLFSPDRARPHLLEYINACIENGHAVAHEIELSGSKVPAVTFMTPDSAEEFMRRSSGSLVKHWVHAVAEATGGLLQSGFNAFRIVSFTTPTILAKYMEHYSSILGTYAP